jgi:hypothetical protein
MAVGQKTRGTAAFFRRTTAGKLNVESNSCWDTFERNLFVQEHEANNNWCPRGMEDLVGPWLRNLIMISSPSRPPRSQSNQLMAADHAVDMAYPHISFGHAHQVTNIISLRVRNQVQ